MTEQNPTTSQEFHWEQPPRVIEIDIIDAMKVAIYVSATLRIGDDEIIHDWQLAVAQLVDRDTGSRSGPSLAERVARHNRRALKHRERRERRAGTPSDSAEKKLGSASVTYVLKRKEQA